MNTQPEQSFPQAMKFARANARKTGEDFYVVRHGTGRWSASPLKTWPSFPTVPKYVYGHVVRSR